MRAGARRKLVPIEHRAVCAVWGPRDDYCGCSVYVVSELLFLRKFWIYWLHITAALVVYRMFER